jgi:hypothetical protein
MLTSYGIKIGKIISIEFLLPDKIIGFILYYSALYFTIPEIPSLIRECS